MLARTRQCGMMVQWRCRDRLAAYFYSRASGRIRPVAEELEYGS